MKLHHWAIATMLATGVAFAAEPKKDDKPKPPPSKACLTAEEGGPDFQLQGEYAGKTVKGDVGVQVIAEGAGKFHAVAYIGGLPGAGWDGKRLYHLSGQKIGDAIRFTGDNVAELNLVNGKIKAGDDELAKIVRKSPTLAAPPPAGSIVLFDGSNLDAFKPGARMTTDKLLEAQSNPQTKQDFTNFTLHIEFCLPFMPDARGQARANSGVYIQGRYEVQVLDSFGLEGVENECGSLYRQVRPRINMCFPPLQWQTYDIDFTAAKFEGDKKIADAVITVKHNGVLIHDQLKIKPTGAAAKRSEQPPHGPIQLQNHGNPVFFRNLWIVEK